MGTFKMDGAIVEIGKPLTIAGKTFVVQNGQVSMRNCQDVMGNGDFYHFQAWLDGQTLGDVGVFVYDLRRYLVGSRSGAD